MNMLNFLTGPSGKTSSIRVNVFLVLCTVLGLLVYCTVTGKPMVKVDPEWMIMVCAAMGIQVWHKGKEATNGKGSDEKVSS